MHEENSAEILQARPLGKRLNKDQMQLIFTEALKEHPRGKFGRLLICVTHIKKHVWCVILAVFLL